MCFWRTGLFCFFWGGAVAVAVLRENYLTLFGRVRARQMCYGRTDLFCFVFFRGGRGRARCATGSLPYSYLEGAGTPVGVRVC